MNHRVLLIMILCLFSINLYGEDVYTSGDIEGNISITVTSTGELREEISDLRTESTPQQGVPIAQIIVNNNDIDGFGINIQSDRGGKLMLFRNNNFPTSVMAGNHINYTVDLVRGTQGVLGASLPHVSERTSINLATPYEVLFDDNVVESTTNAELKLMIHTNAKKDLFHGLFRDIFIISIRDL